MVDKEPSKDQDKRKSESTPQFRRELAEILAETFGMEDEEEANRRLDALEGGMQQILTNQEAGTPVIDGYDEDLVLRLRTYIGREINRISFSSSALPVFQALAWS